VPNILIVDDEPNIQNMMSQILNRRGYDTMLASNGQTALEKISADSPDLILLDLSMPGIDGFEVAERVKKNPKTSGIPVILITGRDTPENHVTALDVGADDFISKTVAHAEIVARVRSHLKVKQLNDQIKAHQLNLETEVALRTSQLNQALDQLRTASLDTIIKLTAASEYRDNETGAHIKRMSYYSAEIAKKMGLNTKTVEAILYAAPMHDIGKIGIPDKILLKPGKLDDNEWEIMKKHTTIGADILKGSKITFIRMGEMIALTHHEKWDGSGYPHGISGRKIPLAGRIVALADAFDAMTSKRPYKAAFSIEKSSRIIWQERGKHFDPDVVDAFFSIQDAILKIKEANQDDRDSLLYRMCHVPEEITGSNPLKKDSGGTSTASVRLGGLEAAKSSF
jgi:putative two-component system response regulator